MKSIKTKPIKEYYDEASDIKWIVFKSGEEEAYQEISPGYNIELDKSGNIIGIEIMNYSKQLVKNYSTRSRNINIIPYEIGESMVKYLSSRNTAIL